MRYFIQNANLTLCPSSSFSCGVSVNLGFSLVCIISGCFVFSSLWLATGTQLELNLHQITNWAKYLFMLPTGHLNVLFCVIQSFWRELCCITCITFFTVACLLTVWSLGRVRSRNLISPINSFIKTLSLKPFLSAVHTWPVKVHPFWFPRHSIGTM